MIKSNQVTNFIAHNTTSVNNFYFDFKSKKAS